MDDYIRRTIQAYDAHPEKYEEATADMTPLQALEKFIEQVPTRDFPILDVGCAFGRDTILFAGRGYQVIGIDISDVLLKRARELHPELVFKNMDVRNLDFDNNSIAGIWCNATLLHLTDEDITKSLKEFRRVLIPDGIIFISFKEGVGEEEVVDKFSSDSARYYNYQTINTVRMIIEKGGLIVAEIYTVNERQIWGDDKRDLEWVHCFAKKPPLSALDE